MTGHWKISQEFCTSRPAKAASRLRRIPAVLLIEIALAYGLIVLGQSSEEPGVIRGRVVNMSQREAPYAGAEVILRAQVDGEFAPVAKAVTDADGNYRFEGLPVGSDYLYLPGANREGIHYPGRRVGLTRGHPTAYVTLEVRDTVAEPSPLVIRQHEIVIGMEPGAVHVVEALLVDNPTAATYVGRAKTEGMMPVTMRLHIPTDFERVTFEKERFGSQFQVVDGRLVTGIPWTPGQQWLKFTYTLRNQSGKLAWQRHAGRALRIDSGARQARASRRDRVQSAARRRRTAGGSRFPVRRRRPARRPRNPRAVGQRARALAGLRAVGWRCSRSPG